MYYVTVSSFNLEYSNTKRSARVCYVTQRLLKSTLKANQSMIITVSERDTEMKIQRTTQCLHTDQKRKNHDVKMLKKIRYMNCHSADQDSKKSLFVISDNVNKFNPHCIKST